MRSSTATLQPLTAAGISFKTQLLYAVVFVTRYVNLFQPFSLYLISMKIFFIGSSLYILYLMRFKFRCVMVF